MKFLVGFLVSNILNNLASKAMTGKTMQELVEQELNKERVTTLFESIDVDKLTKTITDTLNRREATRRR